jgi:hypothetical protein
VLQRQYQIQLHEYRISGHSIVCNTHSHRVQPPLLFLTLSYIDLDFVKEKTSIAEHKEQRLTYHIDNNSCAIVSLQLKLLPRETPRDHIGDNELLLDFRTAFLKTNTSDQFNRYRMVIVNLSYCDSQSICLLSLLHCQIRIKLQRMTTESIE